MANEQMLMGLLKTPNQVRRDEQQRMMEESMARSQMMLRGSTGGTTALPGIISAYGAQAAQRGAQAGAGLLRGISGGIGSMVGGETGQRIADLGISAEERQARSAQEVLQNLDRTNPEAMMQAAQELQSRGLTQAAQAVMQMAQQAQLNQARITSEQALTGQRRAKEQEILAGMQPQTNNLDFAGRSLSDILGIEANILQSFDTASVRKANEVRLKGPLPGESNQEFIGRINSALNVPADKTLSQGEGATVPFADFIGISDAQLRDYSTSSRKKARVLYAEGAKEGETQAQFQKRILDSLLVGLSTEQKKKAEVWAQSAEVAVRGQPGLNKFFSVVDQAITGTGADFFVGVGTLINTLGGNVEGVTESEYVSRLMSKETLNSSQMMSGTLTDRDIDFLRDTVTRLGNTKEAIKFAFAQLEANKLIDQIVYNAYMKEEDKANFDSADVIREVQTEVLRRVSKSRGVNLLGE